MVPVARKFPNLARYHGRGSEISSSLRELTTYRTKTQPVYRPQATHLEMGEPDSKTALVSVKSTLPKWPPSAERKEFTTERLILRPFRSEDLEGLHGLRTQIEVMKNTGQGRNDKDLDETRKQLARHLPPNDLISFNCAIVDRASGAIIGSGGCHRVSPVYGWPEIGYMFRVEYWRKGLATEFVRGFLELYAALPRHEVELQVHPATVAGTAADDDGRVDEIMVGLTTHENVVSQKILVGVGFEHFLDFVEPDLRDPEVDVGLSVFRLFPLRTTKVG